MTEYTNQDKISIIKRINNIELRKQKKKYFIRLFNIVNSSNIKYTNNSNGVFFNLNNLDNNVINNIVKFLDSIESNLESDTDSITTDN